MARDGTVSGLNNATRGVSSASRTFVQNKGKPTDTAGQKLGGDISGAATALGFVNPALGAAVGLFGAALSFLGGIFGK